jgi:hypothetical protein
VGVEASLAELSDENNPDNINLDSKIRKKGGFTEKLSIEEAVAKMNEDSKQK